MVSVKTFATFAIVASVLVVNEQVSAAVANRLDNCTHYCVNRFGNEHCCNASDKVVTDRCPMTPRILYDCKEIIDKPVHVKGCNEDVDCNGDERCCNDVCHIGPPKICVKKDANDQFFLH